MAIKNRSTLQTEKNTAFPTNANQEITAAIHRGYEENALDSFYNKLDESWLASSVYSTSKSYVVGDIISVAGRVLVCNSATSGAYDSTKWDDILNPRTGSSFVTEVTRTTNMAIGGVESRTIKIIGATGVVDTITGGIHGRVYRFIPEDGKTMTLSHVTHATVLVNGTGQMAMEGSNLVLVGRTHLEISDFADLRYYSVGGKEGWGLENYKILS